MNERKFEKARPIPMDTARVQKQSTATIRHIVDAIVELLTNSDDSYRRLEADGHRTWGEIKIYVRRLKGARCERLEVIDFAEGMDGNELEQALTFAGATSGFEERRSVRGLFGRGLKEVITALGKGEIYTVKDNELCIANVWWDSKKGLMYEPLESPYTPSKQEREEIGIVQGNGTAVRIIVTNEKIKCPLLGNFLGQICNHYALRDINSSRNRKITLEFEYVEKKTEKMVETISYERPKTKKTIFENTIGVPGYGDQIQVIIYESEGKLENPYNNPQARAGLLIKTSGAILDNQLFKYQSEYAGRFFFGEVVCEGLAERIREGDWGIITPDRTGINWRHQYCETLRRKLEDILEPYIEEKRKQLEVKPTTAPSERTKKMLMKVCSLLNRLVKEELSEVPPIDRPGKEPLKQLTIIPEKANIQTERIFSVYAPLDILDSPLSEYYQAKVKSDNPYIQVLNPIVRLKVSRKYPDLYYDGTFIVTGSIKDEKGTITCTLGEHRATAEVRVAELKPRGKRGKPERKGGFFREIKADNRENPDQRASYDQNNGIIWIFVRFPVVARYLDESLSPETLEGKTMLAELVGEVYCRLTAREKIERGIEYITLTDPIDSFYRAVTDLQKKSLHLIHEAVFKHTL